MPIQHGHHTVTWSTDPLFLQSSSFIFDLALEWVSFVSTLNAKNCISNVDMSMVVEREIARLCGVGTQTCVCS